MLNPFRRLSSGTQKPVDRLELTDTPCPQDQLSLGDHAEVYAEDRGDCVRMMISLEWPSLRRQHEQLRAQARKTLTRLDELGIP